MSEQTLIGYDLLWREDDATRFLPYEDRETLDKRYITLTGEKLSESNILHTIDNGDWIGHVRDNGYLTCISPMGDEIYKLPDVLTLPEREAIIEALGGPEFFIGKTDTNRAFTGVGEPVSVWPSLVKRGFAIKLRTPLDLIGGFEYEVSAKGKQEITKLFKRGKLECSITPL